MPGAAKIEKWVAEIESILSTKRLTAGAASKLAGRLCWGCSHMFNRIGRAALRPIFDQTTRFDARMSLELLESLRWWRAILKSRISETKVWQLPVGGVVHLFCDAQGDPA
eukprot:8898884-Karenia_brevis.AAC.1